MIGALVLALRSDGRPKVAYPPLKPGLLLFVALLKCWVLNCGLDVMFSPKPMIAGVASAPWPLEPTISAL